MTKIVLLFVAIFMISAAVVAQNPVPDPDTIPDPVKQGDPAVRQLPAETDYMIDMKRIMPEELPQQVRQTLQSSAQYSNWEKAMIYQNKRNEEYLIQFTDAGKTTTYRFDKVGRHIR
jgi:biopolymer transport protein ExbD